jgi:formylglycine-generating enzyme required for sulfatase activity
MWSISSLAFWSAQDISIALFAATAALLVMAEILKPRRIARMAVLLAFPSIIAADYYLLSDVPRMELAAKKYAGLMKRKGKQGGHGQASGHDIDPDEEAAADEARSGGTQVAEDDDGGEAEGEGPGAALRRLLGLDQPAPAKPFPKAGEKIADCSECPELVTVPAATVLIGAAPGDPYATLAESPRRSFSVWPGFAIGRGEVRNAEMTAFRAANGVAAPKCDADFRPEAPAVCVTWDEASAYTAWLSRRTGRHYRLPTAVEWEYAARLSAEGLKLADAGSTATDAISDNRPVFLGFGGGVAEMTADCWSELLEMAGESSRPFRPAGGCHLHVLKDGADSEGARWKRPAARRPIGEDTAAATIGFRVVRELD